MRRLELVQLISERTPTISVKDASLILDKFIEALLDVLLTTGKVELRGFGSFYVRNYSIKRQVSERIFLLKKSDYKRIYFRPGRRFFTKMQENKTCDILKLKKQPQLDK